MKQHEVRLRLASIFRKISDTPAWPLWNPFGPSLVGSQQWLEPAAACMKISLSTAYMFCKMLFKHAKRSKSLYFTKHINTFNGLHTCTFFSQVTGRKTLRASRCRSPQSPAPVHGHGHRQKHYETLPHQGKTLNITELCGGVVPLRRLCKKAFALQPSVSQSFNLSLTPTHGWDKAYWPTVSPVEASSEPNVTRPCQAMFERQSTLQDQGAQGNSDQSRRPWTKNTSHRHHLDRWNMWQYPSSVAIGTQGTGHHLLHSSAQGPVQLLMELVSAFSCRCHLAATTEDSLILIYLDYGHPDPQVNYMVNSNLLLAERHI